MSDMQFGECRTNAGTSARRMTKGKSSEVEARELLRQAWVTLDVVDPNAAITDQILEFLAGSEGTDLERLRGSLRTRSWEQREKLSGLAIDEGLYDRGIGDAYDRVLKHIADRFGVAGDDAGEGGGGYSSTRGLVSTGGVGSMETMGPTDRFVAWYRAPELEEFRVKLNQGWVPGVGHWVWTGYEIGVVLSWGLAPLPGSMELLTVLRRHHWGNRDEWSPESFHRYQLSWLPDLGQLVRMVVAANEDSEDCAEVSSLAYHYADKGWRHADYWPVGVVRDGECEDEPEIAAADQLRRLWGLG